MNQIQEHCFNTPTPSLPQVLNCSSWSNSLNFGLVPDIFLINERFYHQSETWNRFDASPISNPKVLLLQKRGNSEIGETLERFQHSS
jgi:hypothetical protein